MEIENEAHCSKGSASVRVLTSPEDLAEALERAEDFERRIAHLEAARAQRHEAALARASWTTDTRVSTEASAG